MGYLHAESLSVPSPLEGLEAPHAPVNFGPNGSDQPEPSTSPHRCGGVFQSLGQDRQDCDSRQPCRRPHRPQAVCAGRPEGSSFQSHLWYKGPHSARPPGEKGGWGAIFLGTVRANKNSYPLRPIGRTSVRMPPRREGGASQASDGLDEERTAPSRRQAERPVWRSGVGNGCGSWRQAVSRGVGLVVVVPGRGAAFRVGGKIGDHPTARRGLARGHGHRRHASRAQRPAVANRTLGKCGSYWQVTAAEEAAKTTGPKFSCSAIF